MRVGVADIHRAGVGRIVILIENEDVAHCEAGSAAKRDLRRIFGVTARPRRGMGRPASPAQVPFLTQIDAPCPQQFTFPVKTSVV